MNEKFESEKCVLTYLKRKQFFGTIFQILFVKNNIYFCLYIKKQQKSNGSIFLKQIIYCFKN